MKNKQKAVVIDLDGTLCNTDHRQHFVSGDYQKKDFEQFYKNLHLDPPHAWCVNLVKMYMEKGYEIIFCSGRPREYAGMTIDWILRHLDIREDGFVLLMRETGNYEKDTSLKKRIYQDCIEPHYDVEVVIDDRRSVVDMWRSIGLTCLQCAPGDF